MAPFSADFISALRREHRLPLVFELPRDRCRAHREPAWPRVLTVDVARPAHDDHQVAAVGFSERSWSEWPRLLRRRGGGLQWQLFEVCQDQLCRSGVGIARTSATVSFCPGKHNAPRLATQVYITSRQARGADRFFWSADHWWLPVLSIRRRRHLSGQCDQRDRFA
jgi:hypothetical protein